MSDVTLQDVAKLAGVSTATVSYVLNNKTKQKISPDTRKKVIEAASSLKYTPNYFGKALRTKTSGTIGLIVPTFADPSMPVLIKGIESVALKNKYSMLINELDQSTEDKFEVLNLMINKSVDGIIWAYPNITGEELQQFELLNEVPVVLIGSLIEGLNVNSIIVDYVDAGEKISNYLMNFGHKDLVYIYSGALTESKRKRIEGIQRTVKNKAVFKIKHKAITDYTMETYDVREYNVGYELTKELVENNEKFTAILASNDLMAMGVINYLKQHNILIPNDVSVVSFGGCFISRIIEPAITVIRNPHFEIGEKAFNQLLKNISDGSNNLNDNIVIFTEIVEGNTVAKAKNK